MTDALRIKAARTDSHLDICAELHKEVLPGVNVPDLDGGHWWLAWLGATPVAFASMHPSRHWLSTGYFSSAGVIETARGAGIQKKLIDARLQMARRLRYVAVITYTVADNWPSINSLVAKGFRAYEASIPWAGERGVIYWRKFLK